MEAKMAVGSLGKAQEHLCTEVAAWGWSHLKEPHASAGHHQACIGQRSATQAAHPAHTVLPLTVIWTCTLTTHTNSKYIKQGKKRARTLLAGCGPRRKLLGAFIDNSAVLAQVGEPSSHSAPKAHGGEEHFLWWRVVLLSLRRAIGVSHFPFQEPDIIWTPRKAQVAWILLKKLFMSLPLPPPLWHPRGCTASRPSDCTFGEPLPAVSQDPLHTCMEIPFPASSGTWNA